MTAVLKKEFKSYFISPIGYVFIGFLICIVGIYFTINNIYNASPMFGYTLYYTSFFLILVIPVLTMRIMAEERKQKTDQLLYTAPVKITDIVFGKYLALVSVFLIPMVLFCFYPLILIGFGKSYSSLPMDYVGITGYFLLGATCLAIGFFVSTITESQVLAAVITYTILLLSYFSSLLASFIPGTSGASYITLTVIILLISMLVYFMTKSIAVSGIIGVISEAVLTGIYALKSEILEGFANEVIGVLDIAKRIENFPLGNLDIEMVVYYLSVIVLFLFFSVQAINKRRWS